MELHQLHPIFTLWATTEPELAPILLAMAKAIETNADAHQKLLDSVPCEEKEYVAYIEAVKDALNRRDTMQVEYEMTVDDLAKRRLEKDQVGPDSNIFPKLELYSQLNYRIKTIIFKNIKT